MSKQVKLIMAATNSVAIILLIVQSVSTENHIVGGPSGWDLSSNITEWSASTTFYVNDSLVFNYTPTHDVIEVSRRDFANCRSISPISTYNDGDTVVFLSRPGPRYFVCGKADHCTLGLKLEAQVQDKSTANNGTGQPGSVPSPPANQSSNGYRAELGINQFLGNLVLAICFSKFLSLTFWMINEF